MFTTASIGDCLPGSVLGFNIWIECELGLVVVLVTGRDVELCSASSSYCTFAKALLDEETLDVIMWP